MNPELQEPLAIALPIPHASREQYNRRAQSLWEEVLAVYRMRAFWVPLEPAGFPPPGAEGWAGVILPGSPADWAWTPHRYRGGLEATSLLAEADPVREETDGLLIQWARTRTLPLLAVCFGLQSLNVFLGGNLVPHVEEHTGEGREHSVRFSPGSRLGKFLSDRRLPPVLVVNSSHHQALGRLGSGLRMAAECPADNVIEAVESQDEGWFVLGVQWHPEKDWQSSELSRGVLEYFARAVWERRRRLP